MDMDETPDMGSDRRIDVFFYGLYMDAGVLRSRGLRPQGSRRAFIADHAVRLGEKAMLVRAHGERAYGMLIRPIYAAQRRRLVAQLGFPAPEPASDVPKHSTPRSTRPC